jgi:hypothetical protein
VRTTVALIVLLAGCSAQVQPRFETCLWPENHPGDALPPQSTCDVDEFCQWIGPDGGVCAPVCDEDCGEPGAHCFVESGHCGWPWDRGECEYPLSPDGRSGYCVTRPIAPRSP